MRVTTYRRRTPPRDVRVQVDMSAEEAGLIAAAIDSLTNCSPAEAKAASDLERAIDALRNDGVI